LGSRIRDIAARPPREARRPNTPLAAVLFSVFAAGIRSPFVVIRAVRVIRGLLFSARSAISARDRDVTVAAI
jgi:hypothetical protein